MYVLYAVASIQIGSEGLVFESLFSNQPTRKELFWTKRGDCFRDMSGSSFSFQPPTQLLLFSQISSLYTILGHFLSFFRDESHTVSEMVVFSTTTRTTERWYRMCQVVLTATIPSVDCALHPNAHPAEVLSLITHM